MSRREEKIKSRYGPDAFSKWAKQRQPQPMLAKWASWKRHYPDRFTEDGGLKEQYLKEFCDVD